MLKRLFKAISKQKMIPWIGEFKETLAQVLFWGSVTNWIMVAGTFYYTTLRHVLPWFDLQKFLATLLIGIVVMFIIEFKYIVPSIWAFRARQMGLQNKAIKRSKKK